MVQEVRGVRDPEREAAARRAQAVQEIRRELRGKRVGQMSNAERNRLIEALALAVRLVDETGAVGP